MEFWGYELLYAVNVETEIKVYCKYVSDSVIF
jgi:hypothetical protein